jgi:hypothetical protein
MIEDHIKADLAGGKNLGLEQLVQAMEESASQDLRAIKLVPILQRALGKLSDPTDAAALAKLVAWSKTDAHRARPRWRRQG